jgi:hypothetical protein
MLDGGKSRNAQLWVLRMKGGGAEYRLLPAEGVLRSIWPAGGRTQQQRKTNREAGAGEMKLELEQEDHPLVGASRRAGLAARLGLNRRTRRRVR